jgi:energy-coupling factor transport system substrate-specific component
MRKNYIFAQRAKWGGKEEELNKLQEVLHQGGKLLALIAGISFATSSFLFPSAFALVNWGLMAILLTILVTLAFFFKFESVASGSKEVALVSMLATASAVLRIPFAAIPSFQPCTFLIICSGYVFGPISGFMVGAMTPLVSNFFLGQGPCTLYQMFAWGLIGYGAAYLRRFNLDRKGLIIIGVVSGFIFGFITNIYFWLYFAYPLTINTLIFAQLSSLWFDASHAVGNAIFLGLFGTKTIALLERYKKRFSWVYS